MGGLTRLYYNLLVLGRCVLRNDGQGDFVVVVIFVIVVVEAWVCIICASRKMTRQSCRYGTCACQKKMRGITNNRGDRGREMFDSKPVGTRASRLVLFWQSGAPSIHSLQAAGGPGERFRFPQLAAAAARE